MSPEAAAAMQGCVRRKTVQKEGRKPAVASWQRYWLQIWANNLVYFPPKSFKGSERGDFKREPCKVCPLEGWYAHVSDNTKHKNTFELYHRTGGTVYKFRTDSPQMTHLWTNAICKLATTRVPKPLPANLMSFEWVIIGGETNCKRDTPRTHSPPTLSNLMYSLDLISSRFIYSCHEHSRNSLLVKTNTTTTVTTTTTTTRRITTRATITRNEQIVTISNGISKDWQTSRD